MRENKKGLAQIFVIVLSIAFVAFAAIFGFLFIKNMWTQELLPPIVNQATTILEANGNDSAAYSTINSQINNYTSLDFKVDLVFLAAWVSTIIISFIAAAKLPKMNKLQFLTFLFLGLVVFMLGLNFIDQIFTWLVQSFINDTFSASETYLPFFNFYVDNFVIINVLHFVGLLLVNQLTANPEDELSYEGEGDTVFEPIEEDTTFQESNFDGGLQER